MAKPISKKAAMDDAVKGMNMKELTEKMSDAKTHTKNGRTICTAL